MLRSLGVTIAKAVLACGPKALASQWEWRREPSTHWHPCENSLKTFYPPASPVFWDFKGEIWGFFWLGSVLWANKYSLTLLLNSHISPACFPRWIQNKPAALPKWLLETSVPNCPSVLSVGIFAMCLGGEEVLVPPRGSQLTLGALVTKELVSAVFHVAILLVYWKGIWSVKRSSC